VIPNKENSFGFEILLETDKHKNICRLTKKGGSTTKKEGNLYENYDLASQYLALQVKVFRTFEKASNSN